MQMSMACVAALALAGSAVAAQDWAIISTVGDPDPITAFDLANPGDQSTLGFVDGNFNRGMDFDTPNSFYYVVTTDTLNDPGDAGLWYWDNGVNSQLLQNPFQDTGGGGASLSADGDTLYWVADDGSGESLWAYTGLNSGTISLGLIGPTGLGTTTGIAMNPATGALYAIDGTTDSLYKLSLDDGAASLVGSLGGATVGSIGGLDFNADGSTLLGIGNGTGDLLDIDIDTGAATLVGQVGLNATALSFRNIPAPGTLAMLGVAGAAALRRRR